MLLADDVERGQGHAPGERAVADDAHDVVVLAQGVAGDGHADGVGQRGAGVAHGDGVVLRLADFGKAGDAPFLADGVEDPLAPGEEFVGVSLVSYVEEDAVAG
ncbi:Uncharacterised protein [Acinetobacter baumannii]|nr:Uncharacterised protein [Acinetobacter baumannii]